MGSWSKRLSHNNILITIGRSNDGFYGIGWGKLQMDMVNNPGLKDPALIAPRRGVK
jgi:hypothetical protein